MAARVFRIACTPSQDVYLRPRLHLVRFVRLLRMHPHLDPPLTKLPELKEFLVERRLVEPRLGERRLVERRMRDVCFIIP